MNNRKDKHDIDSPERKAKPTAWYQALRSDRFHYFVNGLPVCNKKITKTDIFLFPYGTPMEADVRPSKFTGYCENCMKRVEKMKGTEPLRQETDKTPTNNNTTKDIISRKTKTLSALFTCINSFG